MKKLFIFSLLVVLIFSCNLYNGQDEDGSQDVTADEEITFSPDGEYAITADGKKLKVVRLPEEFRMVLDECKKKNDENSSNDAKNEQLKQIEDKFFETAKKYNIKIYTNEEFREMYPESTPNINKCGTSDIVTWWFSVEGYYFPPFNMTFFMWTPYTYADEYVVYYYFPPFDSWYELASTTDSCSEGLYIDYNPGLGVLVEVQCWYDNFSDYRSKNWNLGLWPY